MKRVLLVEDDAAIRGFIAAALDGLPLELCACADVPQALEALARAPVHLVLTDINLGRGASGLDLLQRLSDDDALRGPARLAVFSGALEGAMRARLRDFQLFAELPKPVPLGALLATVESALELEAAEAPPPAAPSAMADHPAGDRIQAIAMHFGGDAGLYDAFRASCLQQFRADIHSGDDALHAGDLQALRRVAHSLKTVLEMLGHPEASRQAHVLEHAAQRGNTADSGRTWPILREMLNLLANTR